jgi:hypothetical protein
VDAVLTAALSSVPQVGGAGLLGWFLILMLRREGTALERMEALQAKERDEFLAEIARLRKRAEDADARADLEMELRRQAQQTHLGGER